VSDEQYKELAKTMREAFGRADFPEAIHLIDRGFGGQVYSLKSLFKDEQRKVVNEILKPILERVEDSQRELYENEGPLLRFMRECYIPIPKELKVTAEFAVNSLLKRTLEDGGLDLEHVQNLLEDARGIDAPLDQATLEITLRRNLERKAEAFLGNPRDLTALRELREYVAIAKSLPLPLILWSVQNRCWEILQKVYPELKQNGAFEWTAEFEQLAQLLSLRIE
jgi:hypothetical protein